MVDVVFNVQWISGLKRKVAICVEKVLFKWYSWNSRTTNNRSTKMARLWK